MITKPTLLFLAIIGLISQQKFTRADQLIPYQRPLGDLPHQQYVVTVNGTAVDAIQTTMRVGYAHFAFEGKAVISIEASETITSFDLSPHRLHLKPIVDGNKLTFEIDQPRKLHLQINKLQRFFIFADPLETKAPKPGDANVQLLTDMGVTSSMDVTQTRLIQSAIDKAAQDKATLYIPAGHYKTGLLIIPSNLTMYLAPGAILKGTAQPADYERKGERAQLYMEDAQNVRIFGRGVIDNNGLALRQTIGSKKGTTRMLMTNRSSNLVINDIIFRDAAVWCIHPYDSSDMRFANLKIISMTRNESSPDKGYNTDAFDPDNSSNITIENNFISVDDDAIAVKLARGKLRDMENIVFRDNVIFTMCAALKIGTEVHGGFTVRNSLFENNDVIHADIPIAIYCYKGGHVENARWIGNYIQSTATLPNDSPHKHSCNLYLNTNSKDNFGTARNILIQNNTFEKFGPQHSQFRAREGDTNVLNGVTIDNLIIEGEKRTTAQDARIDIDAPVKNVIFK